MEHFSKWIDAAEAGRDELITLRRAIHSEPELGLDCPRTTEKLKGALDGLPLTIRDSKATSGFVARLDGASPGRTVLLRGDMDALPIFEETGLDDPRSNARLRTRHALGHAGQRGSNPVCSPRADRRDHIVHVPAGRRGDARR